MSVWEALKPRLLELEDTGALIGYPDPREDEGRQPPFWIHLAAWATGLAAELHDRFGEAVTLEVGAMRYPDPQPRTSHEDFNLTPEILPSEAAVTLATPVQVNSGRYLRTSLIFRGYGTESLSMATNGELRAAILDPDTAQVVGGYAGPVVMPLVIFSITPNEERAVPLLVATMSFVPALGYSVPPGQWHMAAILRFANHEVVRTPFLPLTVL